MKNKRILITGGAGSIGSELARQLSVDNEVCILDNNETGVADLVEELNIAGRVGDIRDRYAVEELFEQSKPEVVFHAAAYKHVGTMQAAPIEAIKTNIIGLYNVVDTAFKFGVSKFVLISSDKAANPDSIMGASKRFGEILVKTVGKGFMSVRFGNVLGSRGSVIPVWERQIARGGPLTVTDEKMERFFMTIEEACSLVIEAGTIGEGGEIFILDMGQPVNILQLAKDILHKSGKELEIKIIGAREGEKMTEVIMTPEEEKIAIKQGKLYIIK